MSQTLLSLVLVDVKAIRVFDIKEIARCVAAMFLDKPDVASRYPNRLTGELKSLVFNSKYQEEIYHIAAYTLYKVKILLSNGKIESKYWKLRWHIIMAIKYYVLGDSYPNLESPKINKSCELIEKFINSTEDDSSKAIRNLCSSIVDIGDITRDKIKGSSLSQEIKVKTLLFRNATSPTEKS